MLTFGRSTRRFLMLSVIVGTVTAVLVIAQAWLLATVVAGAFVDGKGQAELRTPVELLLAVVLLRAVRARCAELAAYRSSARVKSQLRTALVERVAADEPPCWTGVAPLR